MFSFKGIAMTLVFVVTDKLAGETSAPSPSASSDNELYSFTSRNLQGMADRAFILAGPCTSFPALSLSPPRVRPRRFGCHPQTSTSSRP